MRNSAHKIQGRTEKNKETEEFRAHKNNKLMVIVKTASETQVIQCTFSATLQKCKKYEEKIRQNDGKDNIH